MKQKEQILFSEDRTSKQRERKQDEQYLYNLLFSGRISLKEYFKELKRKS